MVTHRVKNTATQPMIHQPAFKVEMPRSAASIWGCVGLAIDSPYQQNTPWGWKTANMSGKVMARTKLQGRRASSAFYMEGVRENCTKKLNLESQQTAVA